MVDAEAICEAVTRPNMRFVAIKSKEQQDIQSMHKVRSRLVKEKTAIANQIRGLLLEHGITIPQGVGNIARIIPEVLENENNGLTKYGRELFADLYEQFKHASEKTEEYDRKIEILSNSIPICKLLKKLPGIGALTATAIVSTVGDINVFKNGRELSAYLGIVPKQHSSGGKQRLLGISKRGDKYVRCLLVHGARAVLCRSKNLPENKIAWLKGLVIRRGMNRAIVALANKNVRTIWAIMHKGDDFVWEV
jgi:transposase